MISNLNLRSLNVNKVHFLKEFGMSEHAQLATKR